MAAVDYHKHYTCEDYKLWEGKWELYEGFPVAMSPAPLVELLEGPIKPKKKPIVVVSFITGLMLSVFLAFFLEFLE